MTEAFKNRERAKQIYQGAWGRTFATIFFAIFAIALLAEALARKFLNFEVNGNWFFYLIPAIIGANFYAAKQVEKAGISLARVEKEAIARQNVSDAPPNEYDSRASRRFGVFSLIFFGILMLIPLGLRIAGSPIQPPNFELLTGAVFGFFFLLIAIQIAQPVWLRFDKNGVFCLHHGVWPQKVAWKSVANVEIQTVFNYLGDEQLRQLTFKNAQGKVKAQIEMAAADAQLLDRILADLRARLNANQEKVA